MMNKEREQITKALKEIFWANSKLIKEKQNNQNFTIQFKLEKGKKLFYFRGYMQADLLKGVLSISTLGIKENTMCILGTMRLLKKKRKSYSYGKTKKFFCDSLPIEYGFTFVDFLKELKRMIYGGEQNEES